MFSRVDLVMACEKLKKWNHESALAFVRALCANRGAICLHMRAEGGALTCFYTSIKCAFFTNTVQNALLRSATWNAKRLNNDLVFLHGRFLKRKKKRMLK